MANSPLPKMALSRCSDEREEAARDVTGKRNPAGKAGQERRGEERRGKERKGENKGVKESRVNKRKQKSMEGKMRRCR